MGKVKVRVVGDEQAEKEQKEEQKKKREAKKAQVKGVGLGGGQRINSVGVSEEEIAKELEKKVPEVSEVSTPIKSGSKVSQVPNVSGEDETKSEGKKSRGNKQKAKEARAKSKRFTQNASIIGKSTLYPVKNGVEILKKFKKGNFDETVELHINVKEKGISGQVVLPHGTGKKLKIKIADDALIAEVEKGKIDFDILVAEPSMMPKLAKVARILGPKGLMPNPKTGTISDKPEQVVDKLSAGQVAYKTESVAPIIHMSVGKLSYDDKKIEENIQTVLASIGAAKIDRVVLKSTMSPAIRLQI